MIPALYDTFRRYDTFPPLRCFSILYSVRTVGSSASHCFYLLSVRTVRSLGTSFCTYGRLIIALLNTAIISRSKTSWCVLLLLLCCSLTVASKLIGSNIDSKVVNGQKYKIQNKNRTRSIGTISVTGV